MFESVALWVPIAFVVLLAAHDSQQGHIGFHNNPTLARFRPRRAIGVFNKDDIANFPSECGKSAIKPSTDKVTGGEVTIPHSWPWMVAVLTPSQGKPFEVLCGGSLINKRYVLTAAHCVSISNNKDARIAHRHSAAHFTVRLGDHNIEASDEGEITIGVKKIVKHPKFNFVTFEHDIALLMLKEDVEFNAFIQPICLPFNELQDPKNLVERKPFITGWGQTSFGGTPSILLKQAQVEVWDEESCKGAFAEDDGRGEHREISETHICAGDDTGFNDACQRDSGGPLQLYHDDKYYLIGVVSFGKKCGTPGFPGVYARVGADLQFIADNVK